MDIKSMAEYEKRQMFCTAVCGYSASSLYIRRDNVAYIHLTITDVATTM